MSGSGGALTVLITNLLLSGRSGTEIVTRNLALALAALGHRPMVYTPRPGPIGDEIAAAGVPVVSDIRAVETPVDVVHGHHLPTTVAAIARWPGVPALFVCHDAAAWFDTPPHLPSIRRYVAVDETVARRLGDDGVDEALVRVVLNQPDLDRFRPGPPLPARPRRALAFAKNLGHLAAIREACAQRDIPLDVVGAAVSRVSREPEHLINQHDLVFASALTALEAMACWRGVVVCDGRGLAGWVSPDRFDAWRRRNFGLGTLTRPLTADAVGAEIDRFSPGEAAMAGQRVRADGGLRAQTDAFVTLYREILAEPRRWSAEDSSRALAGYVQEWSPTSARLPLGWLRERAHLLEQLERLREGARCQFGARYLFADASTDAMILPVSGISDREAGGRWTDGPRATLALHLPEVRSATVHLDVVAFTTPDHPRQRISAEVNGCPVGQWILQPEAHGARATLMLPIAADRVPANGAVWLQLELPDAALPGGTDDPRRLGLRLIALHVEPAARKRASSQPD